MHTFNFDHWSIHLNIEKKAKFIIRIKYNLLGMQCARNPVTTLRRPLRI